jgi:hypothetical protein
MNLNELLEKLGFDSITTVTTTFVLPVINLLGIGFCSISLWIFSQKNFTNPIFVYYRLLNIVNIIHLLHNVPKGVLFSPRFIPTMNTYASSVYMIYYGFMTNLLYHYEDVLQIGILLTRMKILSPFLQKYFTLTPRLVSILFFLVCFLIDLPVVFAFKIGSFGSYVNFEDDKIASFYYFTSSEFSLSPHGKLIMGVTSFFLNIFLLLVVGVTLNIVSYVQYKQYLNGRKLQAKEYQMIAFSRNISRDESENTFNQQQKELNEKNAEKNMLFMILTLCSLSIGSRIVIMINYIYFFFYYSFADSIRILFISYTMFTLVPSVSIFIYYSFNKMFREGFNNKIGSFCTRMPQSHSDCIVIQQEIA